MALAFALNATINKTNNISVNGTQLTEHLDFALNVTTNNTSNISVNVTQLTESLATITFDGATVSKD